jgi:hypothetical protein
MEEPPKKRQKPQRMIAPLEVGAPMLAVPFSTLQNGSSLLFLHTEKDPPDGFIEKRPFWNSGLTSAQLKSFVTSLTCGYLVPTCGCNMSELIAVADHQNLSLSPCPLLEKAPLSFSQSSIESLRKNLDNVVTSIFTWPRLSWAMSNAVPLSEVLLARSSRTPFIGCSPGYFTIAFGPMTGSLPQLSAQGHTAADRTVISRRDDSSTSFALTSADLRVLYDAWPPVVSFSTECFGRMFARICVSDVPLNERFTEHNFKATTAAIERLQRGFMWTAFFDNPSDEAETASAAQFARIVRANLVVQTPVQASGLHSNGTVSNFIVTPGQTTSKTSQQFARATANFVVNSLYKQSYELSHMLAPPVLHKNGSTLCRRLFAEAVQRHGWRVVEWTTVDTVLQATGDAPNSELLSFPPHHGSQKPREGYNAWTAFGMPVPVVSIEFADDDAAKRATPVEG